MSTPHVNGTVGENGTPKLAVIDSSFAREAKIASRTIKAQDKLISDLKAEVEKQKNAVQENMSQLQQQSLRMEHLEHEITNVKQLNRSLMEDNESYQMLLHEKTINGEIMLNSFMQVRVLSR
jgi:predicted RNase H-like nuclease (RuvC/YqgF family)